LEVKLEPGVEAKSIRVDAFITEAIDLTNDTGKVLLYGLTLSNIAFVPWPMRPEKRQKRPGLKKRGSNGWIGKAKWRGRALMPLRA
jgi:hypothetical protein